MERYRRGHNGADSKSVCVKAHMGSNPILSAKGTDLVSCMPNPFCYVCSFLLSVLLFCEPGDNVFQHHCRGVHQVIFPADKRNEFLFRECYKSSVDHSIQFSGFKRPSYVLSVCSQEFAANLCCQNLRLILPAVFEVLNRHLLECIIYMICPLRMIEP